MNKNVVVYSAPWCAYCRSLKQKLDAKNVDYKEKNVDDPGVREEMNEKTNNNQTIPVLFIGEEYWVNPDISVVNEHFNQ
jgi:glutaredoxin